MMMTILAELCIWGLKYHDKKTNKESSYSSKFAYHLNMMNIYKNILELTLKSDELRKKYLK